MYKILLIVLGFLPLPAVQHFITPPTWCQLASMCNHTSMLECGQRNADLNTRIFLDECDMFEYNCDNKQDFKKVDIMNCQHTTTPVITELPTSISTTITESVTTVDIPKNASRVLISSECTRNTKKHRSVTEASTLTASTSTASTVLTTLSTLSAPSTSESAKGISPINNATTTITTIVTDELLPTNTTSTITPTYMTIANQTANSTPSKSTSKDNEIGSTYIPTEPVVTNCTRNPRTGNTQVLSTEITEAMTSKHTEYLTTVTSGVHVPAIITTTVYEEDDTVTNIVEYTDDDKSKIVPETEETVIYDETENNEAENGITKPDDTNDNYVPEDITTTATSKLIQCDAYPKECDRPSTWETTSKGETRDFFQVLKAKYGTRIRYLRATTHWPRRPQFYLTDNDETFRFGRHHES